MQFNAQGCEPTVLCIFNIVKLKWLLVITLLYFHVLMFTQVHEPISSPYLLKCMAINQTCYIRVCVCVCVGEGGGCVCERVSKLFSPFI